MEPDYEILKDTVLYIFRKRKTAFLMTETVLKEMRFQKEILPKEDKERLDHLLERMREGGLVTLNQPKFAALTGEGKEEAEKITGDRAVQVEKDMARRLI